MDKTILEMIQNPTALGAFVEENMKTSTYQTKWDKEMDVEYEASKSFNDVVANYAAAMLGSVIAEDSDRMKHDLPELGEVSGAISRMGDEWQLPNSLLERYYFMENRFKNRAKDLTETQRMNQYKAIVKFLFEPYELAAIAPHRRIWAQYLEGLSDGQVTLTKKNNRGVVWSKPIAITSNKHCLGPKDVIWNQENLKTMDVLAVLQRIEDYADAMGKTVVKHRISKATAALICQCDQFKNLIGLNHGNWKTDTTPGIGINTINEYLENVGNGYAPFEVINEKAPLADGGVINLFKDGRITAMFSDKVAVLKVADPMELIDPVPNKVYTSYMDNLISQWRETNGRYVAYEMFAFPAFKGLNEFLVMDVTKKEA